ncbi:hypothetical protein BH11PSE8_BH11PSE8_22260 [soil metagenome]
MADADRPDPPRKPARPDPSGPRANRRGRAAQRRSFLAERRGDFDAAALQQALRQRREGMAAQRMRASRAAVGSRDAPAPALDSLWMPIGPTVVLAGQADGAPRVAGRISDLQVSPDGRRAYAATANGGVWFSDDAGESWRPLGGWDTILAAPQTNSPSGVLACGCVYVRFGANAAADEVLVGTGELLPQRPDLQPWQFGSVDGRPGLNRSGVGVLRAVGPSTTDIFVTPWALEANNLAGLGIFRIAGDATQATPTTFVAASSAGLWTRSGAPANNWTQVAAAPFGGVAGAALACTDVCWVRGAGASHFLYVAVRNATAADPGLFVSANGVAGPFVPIALAGLPQLDSAGNHAPSRITLAPAPSDATLIYALANGNLVWRIANQVATAVQRIPPNLLGGQDDYNQAIGVHPTRPERLILGGGNQGDAAGNSNASLYVANVVAAGAGVFNYGYTTAAAGDPTLDDAFVGRGVHADVHCARFVRVDGNSTQIWIGCDGGVFRSMQGDGDNRLAVRDSFMPRNNGIAVLECGYVAGHPDVAGHLLAGTQDNGTLERIGVNLWRARLLGDGGGVTYHPAAPERFAAQYVNSAWVDDGSVAFTSPVLRTAPPYGSAALNSAAEAFEDSGAAFYAGGDAVLVPGVPATARLAIGTYRVWFSADWGQNWVTLPGQTDPMSIAAGQNNFVDPCVLAGVNPDSQRGQVVALRWASPTRLYVLCQRDVLRYELVANVPPPGFTVTVNRLAAPAAGKFADPALAQLVLSPGLRLPELGAWSDIAPHDPARGAHGSFYVATTGDPGAPTMDTVWWFDGVDHWHATGLRTTLLGGVVAPAYAVVVDRVDPTVVYVGTGVGVWRGVFTAAGPSWDWAPLCNGLPEATVQDLSLHDGTSTGLRLLRAAVQARGVWELDLATPAVVPQTMLRVHPFDTRRQVPTTLISPTQPLPNTALSWHASPDVRVRPRRGTRPPALTVPLPWNGGGADPYDLWVFQTALHARGAGDPQVKPNGVWTPLFDARLRAANGNSNRVTQGVWNAIVGSAGSFPNAYADPWNGASASEADLFELVIDRAAPAGIGSLGIGHGRLRVDVQVHHRHSSPVAANGVRVTLLRRFTNGTRDTDWAAFACPWTAAIQTFLRDGGAAPGLLGGDWFFANDAQPVLSPDGPIDARISRTVTFDVDLGAVVAGVRVLLLAIVHSTADPVTLPALALQPLVLGSRFVALRSLEIL